MSAGVARYIDEFMSQAVALVVERGYTLKRVASVLAIAVPSVNDGLSATQVINAGSICVSRNWSVMHATRQLVTFRQLPAKSCIKNFSRSFRAVLLQGSARDRRAPGNGFPGSADDR